jgi:hypothetical protein
MKSAWRYSRPSEKISEGNELIVLEDYTERPSTKLPQGIHEIFIFST